MKHVITIFKKNEIPCLAVHNKISLDPIPDELKDYKKLEKILISKRTLLTKTEIMHGKDEFSRSEFSKSKRWIF